MESNTIQFDRKNTVQKHMIEKRYQFETEFVLETLKIIDSRELQQKNRSGTKN